MTMGEVMCVIEDPAPQRVMRSLSGFLFFCSGKAHPCLLVVKEVFAPNGASRTCGWGLYFWMTLLGACLSSPQASCNLSDTCKAPSDSLLLGPLDGLGRSWIFISSGEFVRRHVHLHMHGCVCVWWVCNLSDTSQPWGRDTWGLKDNTSQDRESNLEWLEACGVLTYFTIACW